MRTIKILAFLSLLSACANIGTLGGGPVDTTAPKLLDSSINKTLFNNKNIALTFDEYVALNQPNSNILLFPNHTTFKTSITNKTVSIKLDSALKPNTSYQLIIQGGIVDVNANNPFNRSFVFTTGKTIDTGKINVFIDDYEKYKPLKLTLTKDSVFDDSFKNFSSSYILPINQSKVALNCLKPLDDWNIIVFTDKDLNNKPDAYKPIGFIKHVKIDSNYTIPLLKWIEPLKIIKNHIDTGKKVMMLYTNKQEQSDSVEMFCEKYKYSLLSFSADSSLIGYNTLYHTLNSNKQITHASRIIKHYIKQHLNFYKLDQRFGVVYNLPSGFEIDGAAINNQLIWYNNTLDSIQIIQQQIHFKDTLNLKNSNPIEVKNLARLILTINNQKSLNFKMEIRVNNQMYKQYKNSIKIDDYFPSGTINIKIISNDKIDPKSLLYKNGIIYQKTLVLKAGWDEQTQINLQ